MKKIWLNTVRFLAPALVALALNACADIFRGDDGDVYGGGAGDIPDGLGAVRVSLAQGQADDPVPDPILARLRLEYWLSKDGGEEAVEEEPTEVNPDDGKLLLEPGDYTLTVKAYVGDEPVAEGSADFTITEGAYADPITVTLIPKLNADQGKGTLTFSLSYPSGAELETLTLTPILVTDGEDIDLKDAGEASETETVTFSGSTRLDAGYYLLRVLLKGDNGAAGRSAVVNIYPTITSGVEYTFTDDDFVFYPATNTGDSGPGSLRQAITDALELGTDTIQLALPADSVITLTSALPDISGKLTISAVGKVTLKRSNGDDALLTVEDEGVLAVTGPLTIQGGVTVESGGTFDLTEADIEVAGTVTVEDGGTIKSPALGPDGLPIEGARVSFGETGKVELAKGATGYYGELLFIGSDDKGFYKWGGDANAKVTLKAGNVTEVTGGEITAVGSTGVAAETSIQIAKDAKLSISDKVTYTVGGTLDVEGDLDVAGTLNVADGANINVDGTLTTAEGSKGDLKGTITVASTGVSYDLNPGGNSLWLADGGSTGNYQFNAGSKAYVKLGDVSEPVLIIGGGDDEAKILLAEDAVFTNWQNDYTLDGDATVAGDYGINVETVTINGGLLTIAANLTLYSGTTLTGTGGAAIFLEEGNKISGGTNFYDAEEDPITGEITASSDDLTYAWNGTLNGWKVTNLITVSLDPKAGGAIEAPSTAEKDDTVTLTVKPDEGYKLTADSLKVNNGDVNLTGGANNTYTFTMPAGNVTVTAKFEKIPYDITIDGIENGTVIATVDDEKVETATIGQTVELVVSPDEGYELKDGSLEVTADGGTPVPITASDGSYTFEMPAADVTVTAEFEAIVYKITGYSGPGGSVSADKATAIIGDEVTLTVTETEGYKLTEGTLKANDTEVELANDKYTFTMPAEDVTVTAQFEKIEYNIKIDDGITSGTVSPSVTKATIGDEVTLTVSATAGYTLKATPTVTKTGGVTVTVTQVAGSANLYAFQMPAADVTVTAEFEELPEGYYSITVDTSIANGTVGTDKRDATAGETVTLTVEPKPGYQYKSGTLKANDTVVEMTNGKYTFEMPEENVTVTAEFETKPTAAVTVTFKALTDEEINLETAAEGSTLSWSQNTKLTVTVQGTFDGYQWALDGVPLEEDGNSLTGWAGELAVKRHTLTVFVEKNDVVYTKVLTFTVEE